MPVHDRPELRDQIHVFDDRTAAGRVLAEMLPPQPDRDAMVLAIPAGGLPVAAVIARQLALPLDVAVVSKIPFPWNPEAGFGAVAFDGTVRMNQQLIFDMGLMEPTITQEKDKTLQKVKDRLETLRAQRPFPALDGRTVILVDDGLASGITMETAIEAVRGARPGHVIVAVPTGHDGVLRRVAAQVDEIYCANIRGGWGFAVASAYRQWRDISDKEARDILAEFVV